MPKTRFRISFSTPVPKSVKIENMQIFVLLLYRNALDVPCVITYHLSRFKAFVVVYKKFVFLNNG